MKILFLSNAPFSEGFVVGSHQLARQAVLNGCDVMHVASPVSIFHVLFGRKHLAKILSSLGFRKKSKFWGVTDSIPLVVFPYGYLRFLDWLNDYFVVNYLRKRGFLSTDYIFIDQPCFHRVVKYLSGTKVYRPTDLYKYMNGGLHAKYEQRILSEVSGVCATSQKIIKSLGIPSDLKSIVINNGVDLSHFRKKEQLVNREGCVYVGALDERFDFSVLMFLCDSFPDVGFDIYGPLNFDYDRLIPSNCNFKGAVDYLELPSILSKYKVGLLPFNDNPSNSGRSPMKLFEYLAAGLVVLSSPLEGVDSSSSSNVKFYTSSSECLHQMTCLLVSDGFTSSQYCLYEHSWEHKFSVLIEWSRKLGR